MDKGYAVVGVKGNGTNGNNLCSCIKKLLFLFFRNACVVAQNKNRVPDLTGNFSDILSVFPEVEKSPALKRSQQGFQISSADPDAGRGPYILFARLLLEGFLDKRTAASFVRIEVSQVEPFKPDYFSGLGLSQKEQVPMITISRMGQ